MARQKPLSYFLFFVSLLAYYCIGYHLERYETVALFATYFFLFALYLWSLRYSGDDSVRYWIYAAIVFRLSLIFAIPSLSDDFYRFVWDGRLLINGFHPFAELPGFYLSNNFSIPGIDQTLYDQLNSKEYFTIYPPFAQVIFCVAAMGSPTSIFGSVVVMRLLILAAEVGSILIIKQLLQDFKVAPKNILIYALNPLVILELTGNLHFEAFVIFFVLLSIFLLLRSKVVLAGISFGLSICAKLLPVIFLPLFLLRLGVKKSFIFYAIVAITCVVLFLPLLDREILDGFGQSFGLYFKRFEFNASIYYLFREYGFWTKGYNTIQTIGWKLGLAGAFGIMIVSLWPHRISVSKSRLDVSLIQYTFAESLKRVPEVMMWVMVIYFLMTTTLHPWYITTLLTLSVFTNFRFVIVWTALIFLTYAGYTAGGFSENLYLTAVEYLLVFGYLVYEFIWLRKHSYF